MLSEMISKVHINVGFGIATGRTVDNALQVLKENNFLLPDIIISSVGTEIYYKSRDDYIYSTGWDSHLHHAWRRARIVELLAEFDFLEYQEEEAQRKYKVSYYSSGPVEGISRVREKLIKNKVKCNMITSLDKFIDIIPYRASKGRAVRYLSYWWNIPMDSILVAGDSGNDEDMLRGEMLGVAVANYSPELEKLKGKRKIYFANNKFAAGIIEGLSYYKFFNRNGNE
jgi:sucrose-phosphate synthase